MWKAEVPTQHSWHILGWDTQTPVPAQALVAVFPGYIQDGALEEHVFGVLHLTGSFKVLVPILSTGLQWVARERGDHSGQNDHSMTDMCSRCRRGSLFLINNNKNQREPVK